MFEYLGPQLLALFGKVKLSLAWNTLFHIQRATGCCQGRKPSGRKKPYSRCEG